MGGSSRKVADQSHSLDSGTPADHPPFMDTHADSGTLPRSAYTFKARNNINSFQNKTFAKSLGGHGPPGYATGLHRYNFQTQVACVRTYSSGRTFALNAGGPGSIPGLGGENYYV